MPLASFAAFVFVLMFRVRNNIMNQTRTQNDRIKCKFFCANSEIHFFFFRMWTANAQWTHKCVPMKWKPFHCVHTIFNLPVLLHFHNYFAFPIQIEPSSRALHTRFLFNLLTAGQCARYFVHVNYPKNALFTRRQHFSSIERNFVGRKCGTTNINTNLIVVN